MENRTLKITGIVIKEVKTKESDKIITVLSREMGVVNIYVKGAMRLKNKFHSAVGLFTYSEFVIYQPRSSNLYQLNEAGVKHVFHRLSTNVEYLALAMYMSELVCEVNVPSDMNEEITRLYLNILYMLTTQRWNVDLCKAAFEMRLMCDIGYRPNFVGCISCNRYEDEIFYFDAENGDIVCPSCQKPWQKDRDMLDLDAVTALRYMAYADLDKMFHFKIGGYHARRLSKVCEKYVRFHTKSEYKTLDFLKSVRIQEK